MRIKFAKHELIISSDFITATTGLKGSSNSYFSFSFVVFVCVVKQSKSINSIN
ncbi:hypothetical protein [Bacillus thuringiensis]|uniref:hypothetical protein n=1 Tax=Bacillus thuringiensis TaxID=1428 RepID=UPI001594126A|nr:hypothetical protein [Bacillus thuringiensis]